MNFLTEYVGIGFEISGMNSGKASKNYTGSYNTPSGLYQYSELITTKMDLFNVMLTGRLNVNPKAQVRVYFPFGVGVTSAKGTLKAKGFESLGSVYDSYNESYTATTTSLGYFLGIGVEAVLKNTNNRWILGAELRYNGFSFDTDKLLDGMKLNGKQHYSYVSFLGKIGYRF